MAEIVKGDVPSPGEPEQLPQGAATQINTQLSSVVTNEQLAVEYDDPAADGTEGVRIAGEEDEILFEAPRNPAPITRPVDMRKHRKPVPNHILRQLPMMKAMAMDPRAPRAARAAYFALMKRLELENNL